MQNFIDLTLNALDEADADSFIEILMTREKERIQVMQGDIHLDEGAIKSCIEKETLLMERLEKERGRLFKEMDNLSQSKRAARRYSPKYPFPPMPVFF
ncbi:MAG: hypothetical protein NTX36_14460 [Proteobacteria bacterium]|nr:hypothetical protein [Pseudomonadota bacterium]